MKARFMSLSSTEAQKSSTQEPGFSSIYGPNPFYSAPEYNNTSETEFSAKRAPVVYKTDEKIKRIFKEVLSILIFPIGLYNLVHKLIGLVQHPLNSLNICLVFFRILNLARPSYITMLARACKV